MLRDILKQIDATDIRDLIVIAAFVGVLAIGAALGAGA
ncbi:hypothetical protein SAMN05443254_11050 [Bradyrhizobium sp. OK095]|nr:hypothetical protein SAMN05443254_11050 [Bradyrhizobium sp. OK095]